jgi:hypothetical protein
MKTFIALTLLSCNIIHTDDASVWRQAAASLSSTAIRAHVEYLTDDLLEGRRAGARGEALAARYIAAQLESYGLVVERRRVVLPVAQIQGARLVATRDNVTVELKPGADFAVLSAPRTAHLDAAPAKILDWSADAGARGSAGLVKIAEAAPLEIAIAPAARPQIESATLRVQATLDLGEVAATDVIGQLRGREDCKTYLTTHHDSFGPGYRGASDAASQVAIYLEVARGLALARTPPRCTIVFLSHGGEEWSGTPHTLAPLWHTPRDRIARDWDWEALKKQAQDSLLKAAEGH